MPQVVRTTNDVIVNSLLLIGELAVGEQPDGFMLEKGLELLNEILDKCSSDSIYIPYLTTINSQFNVGQNVYSISDMMPANITADRIVDLTFANYQVPSTGVNIAPPNSTFTTNAPVSSQLILPTTSGFSTGTPVVLSVTAGGTLPAPLIPGILYYTILVDINHLLIATTNANALAGTFVTLTDNGSGTGSNLITSQIAVPPNQQKTTALIYPLRIINKATYWNVVRQTNLLARPGFIYLDKQPQESFITVYPVPDQPYPFSIQVKGMINELNNQDTLGELPPYYYGFLKRALGRSWLAYYPSANWPPTTEDEYQEYYNNLKNSNETDLTIRPSVTLTAPEPFYWPNILSY